MSKLLKEACSKQNQLSESIKNSEKIKSQRPFFHFSTPSGWCNDPNGFSFFNGKIHLFYQYHPYSTQWGPMHWGHVTTTNFLEWELKPVALAPDTIADCKGCFSGTALADNGKHILVYTGVSGNGDDYFQKQCIAIGDGTVYEKLPENPVISFENIPFNFQTSDFRDPKIWKKDETYLMACVLKQLNGKGALVLFSSSDLKQWNFKCVLDSSKDNMSGMWECPDILSVDNQDLIILSPQEMKSDYNKGFHNGNNSVYITGELDYKNYSFTRTKRVENGYTAAQIDYGIDFYAPETTKLPDGRTIMIGWMQSWESYITPSDYIWSGMMTIPRELSFKNNRLYQIPVRELQQWKCDENKGVINSNHNFEYENITRQFILDIKINSSSKGKVILKVGDSKNHYVILEINISEKYIAFDRSNSLTPGAVSSRKARIELDEKLLSLQIICDTCSLETFIDDGKMAFTNTFFLETSESTLAIKNLSSNEINFSMFKIKRNSD